MVDFFPLGGTAVVERAVEPADVVPTLDVVEDGTAKSLARRPCPGVDELSFDGGEKRFRHGVGLRRRGLDDLEIATCAWVSWFNEERLHSDLGDHSPAEFEDKYRQGSQTDAA